MTERRPWTGLVPFPEKIVELHRTLRAAGLRYAFGGALALAWCTPDARGTIDIDINVFIRADEVDRVLAALPDGMHSTASERAVLLRDGQVRLMWEGVPIDIFLSTTPFHDAACRRTHVESYGGEDDVPFLDCSDLAVFKAFFNRSKDWVDLEQMAAAGTLDGDRALGVLVRYLGGGDERIERLRRLLDPT
jgi:hypothetical protein